MKYLFALIALAIATPASAELIFFSAHRSMSVAGHRFEGDRVIVSLRGGGEMTFDRALITKIAPDEVPYPKTTPHRRQEAAVPAADEPRARRQDGLRSDHRERGDEARRRRAHRESGHPGRIGIPAARALVEGRDGPDAADAGNRAAIRGAQSLRSGEQHRRGHEIPEASCSASSSFRSRWRPTTPAKARCAGSAAFRHTPRHRRMWPKVLGLLLDLGSSVFRAAIPSAIISAT